MDAAQGVPPAVDALLAQPVAPPDKVLKKYSWPVTAAQWLEEIRRFAET